MRVFKNIRRKLVLSGKIKNYLIYAFGEILLIAIGILIAWKINNMNEIRKNNIVQVKIFESLYEDLNSNLNVLDSAIVRYKNNELSLQNTLTYVGRDSETLSQEAKDLIVQIKFRYTNLRDEALSSINNTDKFQFLENGTLTKLIAQYPAELTAFEIQESKIRNIVENRLKPVLEEHVSLVDMLPKDNKKYDHIRSVGKKSNFSALLNDKEYQNSVIDQLMQIQIQVSIGKALRKKTERLAVKLKQELRG